MNAFRQHKDKRTQTLDCLLKMGNVVTLEVLLKQLKLPPTGMLPDLLSLTLSFSPTPSTLSLYPLSSLLFIPLNLSSYLLSPFDCMLTSLYIFLLPRFSMFSSYSFLTLS